MEQPELVQTFWQLLSKSSIEIPIIQRDYAQGRADKEEIRKNFLNALHESLHSGNPIKLDFIYGSIENDAFQPLDGQQRLTTLFLLHWYAARKENIDKDLYTRTLSEFSYETRVSSREFCKALVNCEISVKNLDMSIRDIIVDSPWFFLSWKKDPTIDSMLRSLDSIHELFYDVNGIWENLTKNDLISFYHVDLENIGLTDDLYIKMNARGKLLSSFENFKAGLQKKINQENWDEGKDFFNSFASKIDTIWTDLFWKSDGEKKPDIAFMRFFATAVMVQSSLNRSHNRVSIIKQLHEDPNLLSANLIDQKTFDYLCEVLDLYLEIKNSEVTNLSITCPLFQHKPQGDVLSALAFEGSNASYSQKVLFYAQTEYLRRNEFHVEKFNDWLRVVRNLICRGDAEKNGKRPVITRSPETFDGMLQLVSELAEGSDDIYTYLNLKPTIKSTFAKDQIEEEIVKASIILKSDENRKAIFKCEDTSLLQGRIDFALDCIDFNHNDSSINRLNDITAVLNTYFTGEESVNHHLRRALLTVANENGEYEYYGYWWSKWNLIDAEKRCLIDHYREIEFIIYGKNSANYRVYFKKLVDELTSKSLDQIVHDFIPPVTMPNWKVRLIKEDGLINQVDSNYIAIPSDNSMCYLLKSTRPRDISGSIRIE